MTVRGPDAWVLLPSRTERARAAVLDALVGVALAALVCAATPRLRALDLSELVVAALLAAALARALGRVTFGRSAGEALLGQLRALAPGALDRVRGPLRSQLRARAGGRRPGVDARTAASFVLAAGASAAAAHGFLRANPWWNVGEPLAETAAPLVLEPGAAEASPLPLFYLVARWPLSFGGQPVLYQIPYDKGPPRHFVARVRAALGSGAELVEIEGPRTPAGPGAAALADTARVEACFRAADLAPGCAARRRALAAHFGLSSASLVDWRWSEALVPDAPGVRAWGGVEVLRREPGRSAVRVEYWIPLPPGGPERPSGSWQRVSWQASSLERLRGLEPAIEAWRRSLQILGELRFSREWLRERIARVTPDRTAAGLALAQALLVSQISVDPRELEPFFHLGRLGDQLARGPAAAAARPQPGFDQLVAQRWSAWLRPQIRDAWRFARDIAPDDPRSRQLERVWRALPAGRGGRADVSSPTGD